MSLSSVKKFDFIGILGMPSIIFLLLKNTSELLIGPATLSREKCVLG
jgi:hypothetical protein